MEVVRALGSGAHGPGTSTRLIDATNLSWLGHEVGMRAFVRLRQMLVANAELAEKLDALEEYDAQFRVVFDAIGELMTPAKPGKRIGFRVGE